MQNCWRGFSPLRYGAGGGLGEAGVGNDVVATLYYERSPIRKSVV